VFAYNEQATSGMGVRTPRPDHNTRFEVQVIGEETIHRTSYKKALDWANRQTLRPN
jgi:hypothetical protein